MSYPDIASTVQNQAAWTQFFEEEIKPLAETAATLLRIREELSNWTGMTLTEVTQQEPWIRPFLVGGITENGEYRDASLAGITAQLLGVSIESPKQWVTSRKEGLDADEYVTVQSNETRFLTLLQTVEATTAPILRELGDSQALDIEIKAYQDDPQKLVDELQDFMLQLTNLTANVNEFVFFAYTTRSLTDRYMDHAYPGLDSGFSELAALLGFTKEFIPDINEEPKRTAYTVWGHEDDGILDNLCQMNDAVWECLTDEEFRSTVPPFFESVPDLQQDFKQKRENSLDKVDWTYPSYVEERIKEARGSSTVHVDTPPSKMPTPNSGARSTDDWRYGVHLKTLTAEQGLLTSCTARTVNTSGYGDTDIEFEEPMSLFRFLDDIMPAVFLGRYQFEAEGSEVSAYHA